MKALITIEGSQFNWDGTNLTFLGRGRIDDDGIGISHADPYHQNDTSLHSEGKPLNADSDWYIVIPENVIRLLKGIFLGSQAWVTYQGQTLPAVVGDIGPTNRAGEMSIALALALGIDADPINGGCDYREVNYTIVVGVAAVVNGKQYQLQACKS